MDSLDFLYKQVTMQRMETANKSTLTLATCLDADTTYCYASGLLPRSEYTFFDRYASQRCILSLTQVHALDPQLG